MIFIVHPDRSITSVLESINVGDTAADIIVISPFSGIQCCSLKYLLPNGAEAPPKFLTFQGEGLAMGSGYDGVIYTMKIPSVMTRIPGTVQVSFEFTDTMARTFSSDTAGFTVGGIQSLPFPDSDEQGEDFAEQLKAQAAMVKSVAEQMPPLQARANSILASFENATTEAELVDTAEPPQVIFSLEEGEDGDEGPRYAHFAFKIPQGPTGYSPEFLVVDGELCVKKAPDAEFEPLGIDVISKAKDVSVGEGSEAITKGSVAIGTNVIAGSRGFYISSIDSSSKCITVENLNHITQKEAHLPNVVIGGASDTIPSLEGRLISIINGTHYAFCATITRVEAGNEYNRIYYEPTTTHGTNTSRTDPWWVLDESGTMREDWANHVLWIPELPLVGYDLEAEDGTPLFGAVFAVGDRNCGSADDAFIGGEENIAGGNHATIFGVKNKGAYGNFIACRDNFSTGLHSVLLGRDLENHGDYNFLANRNNTVKNGIMNALFGQYITLENGNCNLGGGYQISLTGRGDVIGGTSHTINSDFSAVFGEVQNVTGHRAGVFGGYHTVKHNYVFASGYYNISGRNGQALFGQGCAADSGAYVVVGGGTPSARKNVFTVSSTTPRESVGTDAVTVSFLNNKLSTMRTSMESALINGSW